MPAERRPYPSGGGRVLLKEVPTCCPGRLEFRGHQANCGGSCLLERLINVTQGGYRRRFSGPLRNARKKGKKFCELPSGKTPPYWEGEGERRKFPKLKCQMSVGEAAKFEARPKNTFACGRGGKDQQTETKSFPCPV